MIGRLLSGQGHAVVLHARNPERAAHARAALPLAEAVLIGDLSTLAAMRDLARQANAHGRFDAVIQYAGVGYREPRRVETEDGLQQLWAVNVLAPYVLTCLMSRPARLIYTGSGMHLGGNPSFADVQWTRRCWDGAQAYSDSKLHDVLLGLAVARRWPEVRTNIVSPGWVTTRMGGPSASDDLDLAHRTQAWLATSDEPEALVTGRFLHHKRAGRLSPVASDLERQDRLIDYCHKVSGEMLC